MNQLSHHISYLLRLHDCVVVPGMGAFIATWRRAKVVEELGMIVPPRRVISFNAAVNHDDGLLAHSYSRKYSTGFEAGRDALNRDLDELRSLLSKGNSVFFESVGHLSLNEEGNILFTPLNESLSPEYQCGLTTVKLPQQTLEHNIESDSEEESESSRYYHFSLPKRLVNISAVAVVAILAFFAMLQIPYERKPIEDRAALMDMEKVIPTVKTVVKKAAAHLENVADTTTHIPEAAMSVQAEPEKEYYLIVATFKTEGEAQRFIDLYSSAAVPLEKVKSRSVSRVYAASSNDKAQLQEALNKGKYAGKFREAWIWHRSGK